MAHIPITPDQCRAARAILGVSQEQLCEMAGVSRAPLADFEGGKTKPYARTLEAIRTAFETAGVLFIDDGEGHPPRGPGVRLVDPIELRFEVLYFPESWDGSGVPFGVLIQERANEKLVIISAPPVKKWVSVTNAFNSLAETIRTHILNDANLPKVLTALLSLFKKKKNVRWFQYYPPGSYGGGIENQELQEVVFGGKYGHHWTNAPEDVLSTARAANNNTNWQEHL